MRQPGVRGNKLHTQRQERSSRVVEKRKEKLATLSSGGGDKAQEILQLKRAGVNTVSGLV